MLFPLKNKIPRVSDAFGMGHYGASRGSRKHDGVDYVAVPSEAVKSPLDGTITKIGYAYAGDLNNKYLEITSSDKKTVVRIFYVQYISVVGTIVKKGDSVAQVGNIAKKYTTATKTMLNHIHFEVKVNGVQADPTNVFNEVENIDLKKVPVWVGFIVVPGLMYLVFYLLNLPK